MQTGPRWDRCSGVMSWPWACTVLTGVPAAHSCRHAGKEQLSRKGDAEAVVRACRRNGGGSSAQRLQRTSSAKAISGNSTSGVQPSSTVMLAGAENVSLLSNQQGRPQLDLQRMLNASVLQQAKAQAALYSAELPASQALSQRRQDVGCSPRV